MRIISKLKDYYDNGAAFGIDTSVVYERKPFQVDGCHPWYKTIDGSIKRFRRTGNHYIRYNKSRQSGNRFRNFKYTDFRYGTFSIIICDKEYHAVRIVDLSPTKDLNSPFIIFWKQEDFNNWLKEVIPHQYFNIENPLEHISDTWGVSASIKAPNQISDEMKEFMLTNRIVSITHVLSPLQTLETFEINTDQLIEYGIQKIIDSTTMFHEIDQWVSMMHDPSRKMIKVSDKDRIIKHGMDETSFRTPKNQQ